MAIDAIPLDARDVTPNWEGVLKAIVDGYDRKRGVPHGVQKDAIQNGWDARLNRRGRNWSFLFDYIEGSEHNYFIMEDSGTYGLTGRVRHSAEELYADLPQEERWIRFENFAFSKEVTDVEMPLGSRGRGKFIFIGTSKRKMIMYDSLREDGTYRFGLLKIKRTSAKAYSWDEEEGRQELLKRTNNEVKPLDHKGTRVIIIDPKAELVRKYQTGRFLEYIEETWWQIIKNYQARILTKEDGGVLRAKVPWYYDLPEKDNEDVKVWIKKPKKLHGLQVKKLHIASFLNRTLPEGVSGIAVQRGGMKITSIDPRRLPHEIANTLVGYITFERPTEVKLLGLEGEDHYNLNFRKATARAVKNYVVEECMKFAVDKLGYRIDAQIVQERLQRTAEDIALAALNRMAKKLDVKVISLRHGKSSKQQVPTNPLQVWMPEPQFPEPRKRRVDPSEHLKIPTLRVRNDSDETVHGKLRLVVRSTDPDRRVIQTLLTESIEIDSHSTYNIDNPIDFEIDTSKFPEKGKYAIVAELESEDESGEETTIDTTRKIFYVKQDPPPTGLFERFEPVSYPDPYKKMWGEAIIGEAGGYILRFNVDHPAWKEVEHDPEEIKEYLTELGFHEICRIDANRESPALYKLEELENPDSLLRKTLDLVGEFMYDFRTPKAK